MGYAVYGYVKDGDCNPVVNATVYPYFKKVDSGSDPSKWADNPYYTDGNGYYSMDIEDADLLDTTGSYKKGSDRLYIAVVHNSNDVNDQLKESLTFTNSAFFVHELVAGADTFQFDFSLPLKRSPIIATHQFPPTEVLTQHNYTMSESSYADDTWEIESCFSGEISQKSLYDLVAIFPGHTLKETIYSWDEILPIVTTSNSSNSYSFDVAGVYNLSIVVWENWNTFTEVTQEVTVKYNPPVPDFHWVPTETNSGLIKGQELVTFINDTADLDGRSSSVYTYVWTVEDTLYDGITDNSSTSEIVEFLTQPTHSFQSPGTKNITLTVYWNDGFQSLEASITKQISIYAFDIEINFSWDPATPENRGQIVTFDPDDTTGDIAQISTYDWTIEDFFPATTGDKYTFLDSETSKFGEGSPDNLVLIDNTYDILNTKYPQIHFHSSTQKEAFLEVTYYNGWVDVAEQRIKIVSFSEYNLNTDFSASNWNVENRNESILFSNTTVDELGLQYYLNWTIADYYAIYNPENPSYGVEVTDNSSVILDSPVVADISHIFQSEDTHTIASEFFYDNGWQMISKTVEYSLAPVHYTIQASFTTSPLSENGSFVGPIDVTYINTTVDTRGLMVDVDWTWVDRDGLSTDIFNEVREDQVPSVDQLYSFKYPSREPFSAIDGAVEELLNKDVLLSVRYDNGWTDNNFTSAEKSFEATPYEIDSSISYNCNITNYTH